MKHNWEYKRLGDVCFPKKAIGRANAIYSAEDEISYFDISSIDNQTKQATSYTTITFGNAPSRAQQIIENGDILYSLVRPNLKNIALLKTNATNKVGTSGFCILRGKDVLPHYILYFVLSARFTDYILTRATGASYPAVTEYDVRSASVPIPPMKIQEQIVAELDKLNEMIAIRKEQLKEFDNLAQSLFYATFGDPITNAKGWPISKLKSLASLITNGTTPKGGQAVYVDSGITFFRSQNVWRNKIIMDDIAYLDENTNASMKSSMLKHNDILITKTGRINTENSSLGRSALFEGEDYTANINGHVYLVRLNEGMCPRFVLSILLSPSFHDLIRKVCVGAIDKRQLNLTHIEQFPIITPPLELQERFVAQIELIEKQKEAIEASIVELQTLLDSRMDYWFN
ncbi:MAG: restriction endonuclease subunit S [Muribaculaceae bacterium]|nr:restriction endonuclease subunit S [Muribaculaceae bacterium]